ncbi:XrtA/PEP-CTERM system TPR-repeat protein PrsT [Pseudoduganella namucuonensis]|uniref:Putative PEP-CTERM system TPR-repeat lipoprotein n=1 Tax=Pseudoduganella namucuonensis TaxID=1035707 RepID=A0A1I7GGZ1_9BURK|nr:XrtA/PEP-CTERM system TPR-repeat protein PrsT [Pseudoduganella namucuonensis]SFU47546.1 putative PEP-CTERM system TPR-repeat lipoprotein [Pseudoduganella namucuonensis]
MSRRVNKLALAAMVSVLAAGLAGCKKQESSAALVAQAKQYKEKGDINASMIQLKNALLANPDDAEARYQLALAYVDTGNGQAAEKEVRRAIALNYAKDQAMPLLAKSLNAQNLFQKALDETEEEAKKGGPELLTARAEAYLALNKRDQAATEIDRVLQAQPAYTAALIVKGRLAFLGGDSDGATRYAEQALAAAPKDAATMMFKADLLRAQRQIEPAIAAYGQVLAAHPSHRSAHIEKAYLLLSSGKFEAAQADLEAAKKITPNSLIVIYTQALLDFAQGKNAAAQEGVQKVLRAAPEHMPTILLAGAVDLNLGATEQAEQHLKKYLAQYPGNMYARKMLATTLLRSGQAPDALTVLTPALKGPNTDVQLLALAGESYMQARDFGKASEFFEKASALAPQAATLRTSLGMSKMEQGNQAQGISELEAAVKLDAKSAQAGIALVRAQMGLKNFDKAYAAVNDVLQAHPDNAVAHDLKGMVHVARKELPLARASFEKALALQPSFFPAVADLAQLDVLEKKPADAKKHLTAFLEKNKKNVEAMTSLAALAAMERNIPEATGWMEQAHNENPEMLAPALRLGNQYLLTRQQDKALALARKMQLASPNSPELLDLLGKSQLATDDKSGALESYSKLAAARPKSAQAQLQLAGVHMMLGNQGAAEDDLKKALALQPDFPAAQTAHAELLVRKKQPDQAVAIARQLQTKYPEAAGGYVLEGDVQMSQDKAALALPKYEKAYALLKSNEVLLKTVAALRASGKGADGDKRLAQAIAAQPQDARLQMYRAEQSINDKQFKQAAEQLEAVLKLRPNDAAVLNNLAYAYQQSTDKRALATAEQAYKLASGEPAIMDTLGWILVEQGDAKRGLSLLQQASTKAPQAGDIRYHLAMGLYKSGDKIGARRELEQALAGGRSFAQADDARSLLKQLQ